MYCHKQNCTISVSNHTWVQNQLNIIADCAIKHVWVCAAYRLCRDSTIHGGAYVLFENLSIQ